MGQAIGGQRLRRMEFEFKGNSYQFALNPEEYSLSEPNRVTITETIAGAFIDSFGMGLQEITLKGTTGMRGSGATNPQNYGFEQFKAMRDLIRQSYGNINDGSFVEDDDLMKFYNYTDEDYFYVVVNSFSLQRSRSRPLLFQYDIKMTAIKALNSAASQPYSPYNGISTAPAGTPLNTQSDDAIPQAKVDPVFDPVVPSTAAVVTSGAGLSVLASPMYTAQ